MRKSTVKANAAIRKHSILETLVRMKNDGTFVNACLLQRGNHAKETGTIRECISSSDTEW